MIGDGHRRATTVRAELRAEDCLAAPALFRRLMLEFDPLEDLKLAEWDAGAEVSGQRGEQ